MQVSSFMELFPALLSRAVDQCDLNCLYPIKFSSCCLQCLLRLTPKYWSVLLSCVHISPYNRYALLNEHCTHSISQPAPLRLSLFIWNFSFFQSVLIIVLCSYFSLLAVAIMLLLNFDGIILKIYPEE